MGRRTMLLRWLFGNAQGQRWSQLPGLGLVPPSIDGVHVRVTRLAVSVAEESRVLVDRIYAERHASDPRMRQVAVLLWFRPRDRPDTDVYCGKYQIGTCRDDALHQAVVAHYDTEHPQRRHTGGVIDESKRVWVEFPAAARSAADDRP